MVSGRIAHSEILREIRNLELDVSQTNSSITTCEGTIKDLSKEQEEIYSRLAIVYLPQMDAQHVQATLHEVRTDVQEIFDAKTKRRILLEDLSLGLVQRRLTLDESLEEVASALEEKTAEKNAVKRGILADLDRNTEYQGLRQELETQVREIDSADLDSQNNRQKLRRIKTEIEKNPVHSLLYRSRRKNPLRGGLVKAIELQVAKITGFEEAYSRYIQTQSDMDASEARVQVSGSLIRTLKDRIKSIEDLTVDSYGLDKVEGQIALLDQSMKSLTRAIDTTDKEYSRYEKEKEDLDKKDPYHLKALAKLQAFLKSKTLAELREKASENPVAQDYVQRIEGLEAGISNQKRVINDCRARLSDLNSKLVRLRRAETTMTRRGYTSSRSEFGDDLVTYLILLNTTDFGEIDRSLDATHSYSSGIINDVSGFSNDYGVSAPDTTSFDFHSSGADSSFDSGGFDAGGFD